MPELPEVETTRRGILPHVCGQTVTQVIIRQPRLRYPVPARLRQELVGQSITTVSRRAKYLLLGTSSGTVIIHLGMSGSLRLVSAATPAQPHDHVDIVLHNKQCLRLRDPRRFGLVLWTRRDPLQHKLLSGLGPEPLAATFNAEYLQQRAQGRRSAIKSLIMDGHIVVGVGNIYASEALFMAGIHPRRQAGRISLARYVRLVDQIRLVLTNAIAQGGTTLKDFYHGADQPGYFKQSLQVYGRADQPCLQCGGSIRQVILAQRATYYCPHCQH